jgi:hypothetical protein
MQLYLNTEPAFGNMEYICSCILRTLIYNGLFFIYFCSVYFTHHRIFHLPVVSLHASERYRKYLPSTLLLTLKIRDCSCWGNCEQHCMVVYGKYFSCFSITLVCTCVKISRWERIIIFIQRRIN